MSQSHPSAFDPGYSRDPESQLQVVVHAGPLAGKGFPITSNLVTFGRDPENDISWEDSQVSRFHAHLKRQGNQLILEDLGSTNGTLVNGKPVIGEHVLQPADIISIGSSIFGVKGFSAPNTIGVTQISRDRLTLPPALARAASPPPQPAPQPRPVPASQAKGTRVNMLVISGILALVVVVIIVAAISAYFLMQEQETPLAQIPKVVITAPVPGSEVSINQPVTVQATASDPAGVVRMELWVDGVKTAEAVSPVRQGQPTLTASLQWVPATSGNHTLEVKAYNQSGQVSEPTAVVVAAIDASGNASPTPTFTPETPTATVPNNPFLTTKTDLNVRAGPDTAYDLLGLLPSGTNAEILGRDEGRQWWQIRFNPSPNGIGWVAADPEFSTTYNVDNLPVSAAPPTPTGTPTTTPTNIPTSTTAPPTATLVPPTDTPTPTHTPTPPGPEIDFEVSPTTIQGGQCVEVSWSVANVREVYYQGEGVAGVGDRTECPQETTIYRLRVVRQDGTEQVEDRTVEVINPIISAGTLTLEHDDTVDLDEGETPGDDFKWETEDGGIRRFEVRDDVRLAIMGRFDSLDQVSINDCANADYDDYTYVDASDVIEDEDNALKDGLVICYRTSQNRLGKLRFPEYSTGSLRIRWVTW
jgi:pSer/pThr/pTyr-binding forkhead associated (FHA) protein/uncharacterized protein YraI